MPVPAIKLITARDLALALKKKNDELRRNTTGIARAKTKPNPRPNNVAGLPPLSPRAKSSLPKSAKKMKLASTPARLLWFQQY
jgi:hypothetical protein